MNNIKAFLIACGMAFVVIMTTYSCSPQTIPIDKKFDRSGEVLEIAVLTFDSYREMYKAIQERHDGMEIPSGLQGLALWHEDEHGNPASNKCLVYVLAPQTLDDERTLTLGHEINHCLYGSFHKE